MAAISSGRKSIGITRFDQGGGNATLVDSLDELFEWVVERILWEARDAQGAQSYAEGDSKAAQMAGNFERIVTKYKREVGGVAEIVHAGRSYFADCQSEECKPEATFICTQYEGGGRYEAYTLSGGHTGPTIRILVENARMEPGEYGGWDTEYDGVFWDVPNITPGELLDEFDDLLWEIYGDKVREQIREGYSER